MARLIDQALSQEEHVEPSGDAFSELEAAENELELESLMHEATEAEHELDYFEYQQEELEHAVDVIDEIRAGLESSLEEDERGIDAGTAQAYDLAYRAVVGQALPSPIASMESFGGDTERKEATELSLEESKGRIRKIIDSIVQAIKSAWESFKKFLKGIFDSATRLKKAAEKTKSQLEGAKKKGWTKKEEKFSAPKAARLQLGGDISASAIDSGLEVVASDVVSNATTMTGDAVEYMSAINQGFEKAKDDDPSSAFTKASEKVSGWFKSRSKGEVGSKELPGGKAVMISSVEGKIGDKEVTIPAPPRIDDHPQGTQSVKGEGEVEVPELDTLIGWCDAVIKGVDEIEKGRRARDQLAKTRKDLLDSIEEIKKAADKGALSAWWTQQNTRAALWFANRNYDSAIARLDNFAIRYYRDVLSYVNAAVGKYQAPKDES